MLRGKAKAGRIQDECPGASTPVWRALLPFGALIYSRLAGTATPARIRPPHTPGSLYECQRKGLIKFAFRKRLILKSTLSVGCSRRESHHKKEKWHAPTGAGLNCRTPENIAVLSGAYITK